jgi:hypothetical protein
MYVQGTYDTRWSNDVLNPAFGSIKASDFEVIQLGWKPGVTPPPPTPPAAPSGLQATAQSSTQIGLAWADNSSNEQSFRIEMKSGAGAFAEVASVSAGVTATAIGGLAASTSYTFRVRARNTGGDSSYSNQAAATTQAGGGGGNGPCVPGDLKLCLAGGRFAVTATWRQPGGASGSGHAIPLTTDTGYFWFFSAANVETVVKVLNACGVNQRYWVFAGGLTNVRTEITVTDTTNGAVKTYTNPQSTAFLPIQDTGAFVCP